MAGGKTAIVRDAASSRIIEQEGAADEPANRSGARRPRRLPLPPLPADDDLVLVSRSVISRVQQSVQRLSDKQDAVRRARGRLACLHVGLLDQVASTARAARGVLVARVRLSEAENAIAQVASQVSCQVPGEGFHLIEVLEKEKQIATQERNAARTSASLLMVCARCLPPRRRYLA